MRSPASGRGGVPVLLADRGHRSKPRNILAKVLKVILLCGEKSHPLSEETDQSIILGKSRVVDDNGMASTL